ncbi:GNAT family N-acetyltransferase [filamentous cyanobacterium CCP1]|nr:GNAT family N-acetyltransferase [filamentous cyanobacterium CCP2]PSB68113.1 GNAT family N-acetyltransferase [filamentous cyanobacterium CCP1]
MFTLPKPETVNVIVRPATHQDIPAIVEIYNDAVIHTTASYDYYPTTLDARIAWYEAHIRSQHPIFVAEDGRKVVGWSALSSFRHADGYCYSAEDSVYVSAGQRGRGIGKLLMNPLIDTAQQMGLHTVIAGIDAANGVSIRLHETFGFQQVGYLKEIAFKFDRWLDLILMQRML